jgi:hypothetical protein
MVKFSVVAYFQGKKANVGTGTSPCMTIPAEYRTLDGTFQAPGWLRLRVNSSTPFFAYARRPPSRASVDVTLPRYCAPGIERGTVLHVEAESAEPYAARPRADSAFDWLPHVTHESYFPVDGAGGALSIWNQHEPPFELTRVPPPLAVYRVLGLWQAEGTKGQEAVDFTFANTNPLLLAHAIDLLAQWGLPRSRLSLEVLHAWDEPAVHARQKYEALGVEIVAERARAPGRGENAGIIHVRKSSPLLRIARVALAQIFAAPFPSPDAAREFALGWLDGDGAFVDGKNSKDLRLAGHAAEHRVVKRALAEAFGWTFEAGSYHRNTDEGTHITLRAGEMLQLLDARAFVHSMNRVRLLLAFGERAERLDEVDRGVRAPVGAFGRWGLLKNGQLTEQGVAIVAGWRRYKHAVQLARHLQEEHPELFGKKGVPYPPGMNGL